MSRIKLVRRANGKVETVERGAWGGRKFFYHE